MSANLSCLSPYLPASQPIAAPAPNSSILRNSSCGLQGPTVSSPSHYPYRRLNGSAIYKKLAEEVIYNPCIELFEDPTSFLEGIYPRIVELSTSQHTLNRSLSSPDVLLNVPLGLLNSYPSSSSTPSPLPNGDLTLLVSPASKSKKNCLFSSMESLASSSFGNTSSINARNGIQHKTKLEKPQVQLNGSLLSIGNSQLLESANKLMEQYSQRRPSIGSTHSDSKRNLVLLQNVGRTLQRTHSHLKRTRLLHCFYLLALPVYTLFGAFIFQALDGAQDDYLMKIYNIRCREEREERLEALRESCLQNSTAGCFDLMIEFTTEIEGCYRRWHAVNKTMTHPMSDFTNAVIYAFSVYTTIGYGTISASTMAARIATVIYGTFGIPLFFAFIKEEGNQCRILFIWMYNQVKEWLRKRSCRNLKTHARSGSDKLTLKDKANILLYNGGISKADRSNVSITMEKEFNRPVFVRNSYQKTVKKAPGKVAKNDKEKNITEQRRVFLCGVLVFIVYLFAISGLFAIMADWDYFTAFYFLFNSVALIGFGDVFPSQARIILVNMFFIVMGVVLFSMCYFILQEEIRVKAFEASRKARMSISKYSHSLMLHTKNPWSRRNSPAFDKSPFSDGSSGSGSAFDRLRKRRQSAPVITLETASRKTSKAEVLFS